MKKFKDLTTLVNESNYQIYHHSMSDAFREVERFVAKKGFTIDEEDYFQKVATGSKKPSEGKTNSYSLALNKGGKPTKKYVQVQIYGMRTQFELNMYI